MTNTSTGNTSNTPIARNINKDKNKKNENIDTDTDNVSIHAVNAINATKVPKAQFERLEYDVTDKCCQSLLALTCPIHFMPLVPGVMGKKTMILEEEEAVLNVNCKPCCTINTRRPYGELGSVDQHNCLCCTGVSSGLSANMPIYVGCGCEYDRVAEIVAELKKRMKARGDTGQLAKTEEALEEIRSLRDELSSLKVDMQLVLRALNVPQLNSMEDRLV